MSDSGVGVYGSSDQKDAIQGISNSSRNAGVSGTNTAAGSGLWGKSQSGYGLWATSSSGAGIHGESQRQDGIQGQSADSNHSGVWGNNTGQYQPGESDDTTVPISGFPSGVTGTSANGVGVYGKGGYAAGWFDGQVITIGQHQIWGDVILYKLTSQPASKGTLYIMNGDVTVGTGNVNVNQGDVILGNADCAEDFDCKAPVDPGTVMVLSNDGRVSESSTPYDKRVAGVVSGAGNYKPAVILDRHAGVPGRVPLSLVGKVYCKVDAQYGAIDVGDLLTTSATAGHAMKAKDPFEAFGAVIGKALGTLHDGKGLIPVLIALQ